MMRLLIFYRPHVLEKYSDKAASQLVLSCQIYTLCTMDNLQAESDILGPWIRYPGPRNRPSYGLPAWGPPRARSQRGPPWDPRLGGRVCVAHPAQGFLSSG